MHPLELFGFCPKCGSSRFNESSEKSKKCENCGFEFFSNPAAAVAAFITNERGELLVQRRKYEPAKGMLDLPGGFCDGQETAEESVVREVKEETSLEVTRASYLFSMPNVYRFSGMDLNTLDMFFECEVKDTDALKAGDETTDCRWMAIEDIRTELFGLRSIRHAMSVYIERKMNGLGLKK